MKSKKISLVLMIVFGAIFVFCAAMLIIKGFPDKSYKKSKNTGSVDLSNTSSDELPENPVNFAELKSQNDGVVGYITVDGTIIDNPVMQSTEDMQEDFYLDHDWLKSPKFAGSIYMQKQNHGDFTDMCTVLYGHNTRAGSEMFSELKKFRDSAFFEQNRYITVCTPGHVLKYEIFSAFTYDARHILNSFVFYRESDYNLFVNECLNPKTLYTHFERESAAPVFGDKLLVLSTCTDNYSDDLRYLVVAKQIEDIKTK